MDAVRVDGADLGIGPLVAELVPHRHARRSVHGASLQYIGHAHRNAALTRRADRREHRREAVQVVGRGARPFGRAAALDPACEGVERALAILARHVGQRHRLGRLARPMQDHAIQLLALLESAAEGELEGAAAAVQAPVTAVGRGGAAGQPAAAVADHDAVGEAQGGDRGRRARERRAGLRPAVTAHFDRLVVEHEAQRIEVMDRHVAEQRLLEKEIAVAGAEVEVEVEVAGDQMAERAVMQQSPGEHGRGEPAVILADHEHALPIVAPGVRARAPLRASR